MKTESRPQSKSKQRTTATATHFTERPGGLEVIRIPQSQSLPRSGSTDTHDSATCFLERYKLRALTEPIEQNQTKQKCHYEKRKKKKEKKKKRAKLRREKETRRNT